MICVKNGGTRLILWNCLELLNLGENKNVLELSFINYLRSF